MRKAPWSLVQGWRSGVTREGKRQLSSGNDRRAARVAWAGEAERMPSAVLSRLSGLWQEVGP